jgi:hypothetical protein
MAAGLLRCGKSCRLRWINYLRPDLKRGNFSEEEDELIIKLHSLIGNKWSLIAARLPGRTDNEIKNHWNSHIKRKLASMGLDPRSHRPLCPPHNSNTTCLSRPAPDHEIPAFQNRRTPEITDFFQHHRSESSPIERAASDVEEHRDLDLDLNLCISLPSNLSPAANRGSSVHRTVVSYLNSGSGVCYPIGLQVNYGGYCESGYSAENAGGFSQYRLAL